MRIRVATLNAWALPEPLAADVEPRLRAIGAKLPELDADVVAFQELWTAPARARLVEAGLGAGLVHSWQSAGGIGDGGLLVLSRRPIERAEFEPFFLRGEAERLDHGEYWSGKGVARLRLAAAGAHLCFLDTHLHARYNQDAIHRYRPHRVAQLVQLVSSALRHERDPVVLAGDLNFEEGDPEYRVLRGLSGLRDVAAELDRREPTTLATNPYREDTKLPSRRIDYVLVRDGAERGLVPRAVRRVFDEPIEIGGRWRSHSDHAGVLAELELAAPAARAPTAPDPRAIERARALLAEGRADARQRANESRTRSLVGVGAAGLAVASGRLGPMNRRRFVRSAFRSTALVALAPAAAFGVLAEHYAPDEIRAFERAAACLDTL